MYIASILWFLSWPLLITVSYFAVRILVRKAEQKNPPGRDS